MGTLFTILMAIGCTSSPAEPQSIQEDSGPTPTEPTTTNPGQVTDLIVTDSTGTAVTLSFTQVDDGTGNPAAYAVRSHVGPMNWGGAVEVTQGTCAAPLQGTAVGSTMSCTIEDLSPDVAYTFQVAAFRGTFQAGAVYGELSNVVPDMEESSGPLEHEPSDFKTIIDENWPSTDRGGWEISGDQSNASIVSVLGASDVLQFRYPEGMEGGSAPVTFTYDWGANSGGTTDDVSIGMRWTTNSNWQAHDSHVDKIAFVWLDDSKGSHFVIVKYGNKIRVAPQKASGWEWLVPTTNAALNLGDWNDLEFRFKKTGTGLWHVTWWVNGELNGNYENVPMPADDDGSLRSLQLSPTWGGMGDVKTQTDFYWWDRIRTSAGDI